VRVFLPLDRLHQQEVILEEVVVAVVRTYFIAEGLHFLCWNITHDGLIRISIVFDFLVGTVSFLVLFIHLTSITSTILSLLVVSSSS
jgi:hypothetical protein